MELNYVVLLTLLLEMLLLYNVRNQHTLTTDKYHRWTPSILGKQQSRWNKKCYIGCYYYHNHYCW